MTKNRKPLPPSPDVPVLKKSSIAQEHISPEAREGKKEEYQPQVPRDKRHERINSETAEGAKEEYSPKQPKDKGY